MVDRQAAADYNEAKEQLDMNHFRLIIVCFNILLVCSLAHAEDRLKSVQESAGTLYDCQYAKAYFDQNYYQVEHTFLSLPGCNPTKTVCLTKVKCVRKEIPEAKNWVKEIEMSVLCNGSNNGCPEDAQSCVKDDIGFVIGSSAQVAPINKNDISGASR